LQKSVINYRVAWELSIWPPASAGGVIISRGLTSRNIPRERKY